MMYIYLLLGMCLAFEIHKLLDFKIFNRLNYFKVKYETESQKHTTYHNKIMRLQFVEIAYFIVVLVAMFVSYGQSWFFFIMIWMWIFLDAAIRKSENKKTISMAYFTKSVLSIVIIILASVNFWIFKMDFVEFFTHLISMV